MPGVGTSQSVSREFKKKKNRQSRFLRGVGSPSKPLPRLPPIKEVGPGETRRAFSTPDEQGFMIFKTNVPGFEKKTTKARFAKGKK